MRGSINLHKFRFEFKKEKGKASDRLSLREEEQQVKINQTDAGKRKYRKAKMNVLGN